MTDDLLFPEKKRRHGPEPKPARELHGHCVSVRLCAAELALLDQRRGTLRRGACLRLLLTDRAPVQIPEPNRQAWRELSRVASNLNQLAHRANLGLPLDFQEVDWLLKDLRRTLIGAKPR